MRNKAKCVSAPVTICVCAALAASLGATTAFAQLRKSAVLVRDDLTVSINGCPRRAEPGQDLGDAFTVNARNKGSAVEDVVVDLVLTTKSACPVPLGYAVYSEKFSDGVLLKGGRENISLSAGESKGVKLNGSNTIPKGALPGRYLLSARIDAGNKVREVDETNNCGFCPIIIGEPGRRAAGTVAAAGSGRMTERGGRDLVVDIDKCPSRVDPGQDLGAKFAVIAGNKGPAVKDVAVDIVLTTKRGCPVPLGYAVYSESYSDGVLLKGGREHVSLADGEKKGVKLNGANTIPKDTPAGKYMLSARIDAGNQVQENDEANNCAFCPVIVGREGASSPGAAGPPDLVVPSVAFERVKQDADAGGKPYWLFNVIVTVKNQGQAAAGPFKVLLERNVGAGGAYTVACQSCAIGVEQLGSGESRTLPSRQFNNAMGMSSLFRATADAGDHVAESDEGNNMRAEAFE